MEAEEGKTDVELLVEAFTNKDASAVAKHALKDFGDEKSSIQFFSLVLNDLKASAAEKAKVALAALKEVEEEAAAATADVTDAAPKGDGEKGATRRERQRGNKEDTKRKNREEKPLVSYADETKKVKSGDLDFIRAEAAQIDTDLFILLPNAVVGPVIGKQGSTIKSIQRKTGSKIEIERVASWGDGALRLIYLSGNLKTVSQAAHQIGELADVEFITVLVPNSICGVIIGKGGGHIKQMENDSGATIKMQPEDEENIRKIQLIGGLRERTHAQYLISKLVAQDQRKGHFDPRERDPAAYNNEEQRMPMNDQRAQYEEMQNMQSEQQAAALQMQMQNEQQMLQALYQQQLQQQQALAMAQQQQPQFAQQTMMGVAQQPQALQPMTGGAMAGAAMTPGQTMQAPAMPVVSMAQPMGAMPAMPMMPMSVQPATPAMPMMPMMPMGKGQGR